MLICKTPHDRRTMNIKVSIPYIQQKFGEFNRLIFAGKLPEITIQLSRAKTYLGACTYKKKRDKSGATVFYDFRLRISTYADWPESVIEDTIIHEMIHYYIGYHRLNDSSPHGRLFRQMMNDINHRFGRNITVSHRMTDRQTAQVADGSKQCHVVAWVQFKDGRCGIKVLPRRRQSILFYYNRVKMLNEVAGIRLYTSDDCFFNRFPRSKALKVHIMDKEEAVKHLSPTMEITP